VKNRKGPAGGCASDAGNVAEGGALMYARNENKNHNSDAAPVETDM